MHIDTAQHNSAALSKGQAQQAVVVVVAVLTQERCATTQRLLVRNSKQLVACPVLRKAGTDYTIADHLRLLSPRNPE